MSRGAARRNTGSSLSRSRRACLSATRASECLFGTHEGSVEEGTFKLASRLLDFQALRLLRAFFRIADPKRRQEVILHAEELASSIPDTFPPPDGVDR